MIAIPSCFDKRQTCGFCHLAMRSHPTRLRRCSVWLRNSTAIRLKVCSWFFFLLSRAMLNLIRFSIHCSDEFSFTAGKKGVQESDCFCIPNPNPKTDAFMVMSVNWTPIEDYFWVEERVPVLVQFVEDFNDSQKVKWVNDNIILHQVLMTTINNFYFFGSNFQQVAIEEKRALISVFGDFILFLTTSDDMDPMTREGTLIPTHQTLIGKHPKIFESCMAIFGMCFFDSTQNLFLFVLVYPSHGSFTNAIFFFSPVVRCCTQGQFKGGSNACKISAPFGSRSWEECASSAQNF